MAIKKIKATSNATRGMSVIDFRKTLTSGIKSEKSLTHSLRKTAGRSKGTITSSARGGGSKRQYRMVDFKQVKFGIPATVKSIEYDPNRSAFLALLHFADGEKSYILAPQNLLVGDKIIYNEKTKIKPGNRLQLKFVPAGVAIHNIELQPGRGGQIVRSAGLSAVITGFDKGMAMIKMPSSEIRLISMEAYGSIGVVSNPDHENLSIGKAGRVRRMGRRPQVRGKAKNPVDHPHGGGEGNTSLGMHPKSPWGKPTLGVKTRKKQTSDKFIIKRRKAKK